MHFRPHRPPSICPPRYLHFHVFPPVKDKTHLPETSPRNSESGVFLPTNIVYNLGLSLPTTRMSEDMVLHFTSSQEKTPLNTSIHSPFPVLATLTKPHDQSSVLLFTRLTASGNRSHACSDSCRRCTANFMKPLISKLSAS